MQELNYLWLVFWPSHSVKALLLSRLTLTICWATAYLDGHISHTTCHEVLRAKEEAVTRAMFLQYEP